LKSEKVFFWTCDFKSTTGEGRLAKLYLKEYKKKIKKNFIKIPDQKLKIFNYKYFSPFFGILYAWYYFIKREKFLYLNYLPLWNFLIFLLLPPKCEIGPITGGAKFDKQSKDFYIRNFIFPLLYFFSNIILNYRFKNLIFSTDLLKNYLHRNVLKKSKFNFIFNGIQKNKKKKIKNKKIKLLLYFRKHNNKNYSHIYKLIEKLVFKNHKVHVIGDRIHLQGVKNNGYISHTRVIKLLKNTKYSIISSENIFSFFTIDCINNNVKILVSDKTFNSINNYKKKFIKFNFKKNNLNILK
jgi:hypothetical protein